MDNGFEKMLKPEEVREILRISEPTFYRLTQSGRLPAAKIGGEWRVKPSVLKRYIERQTVKPSKAVKSLETDGPH
jgi:excisionase family DNA binding protein